MTHSNDKTNRPTWPARLHAYQEVQEWAEGLTRQTDTFWTEAFTDAEAEAFADLFEALNGISDALTLFCDFPEQADFTEWPACLVSLRRAVERMEAELGALPWITDEAGSVRRWARRTVINYEASYARALMGRTAGEVTA